MANLARGRQACIYVAPVEYDEEDGSILPVLLGDMTLVRRLKDISATVEAKTVSGTTRDLEYEFNAQDGKALEVTADRLIEEAESGGDYEILRDAFINDSELWVLLTRQERGVDTDDGLMFVGEMFGWPENLPEGEMVNTTLTFKPSDPDESPVVVAAAFAAPVATVPGGQTTPLNTAKSITGISMSIADTEQYRMSISVAADGSGARGLLTLAQVTGLTLGPFQDGTLDSSLTFSGTKANVLAAIATVTFTPRTAYSGTAAITVRATRADVPSVEDVETITVTITP
jgi:hypothetical protein|tara:strand:+ start:8590 stop:9450 length:861 start_codon:yes stop_codon:yes gene_type:complete